MSDYYEYDDTPFGDGDLETQALKRPRKAARFMRVNTRLLRTLLVGCSKNASSLAGFFLDEASHKDNMINYTCRDIEKVLNLSESAVMRAVKELQDKDYVRCAGHARWMLNPKYGVGCEEQYRPYLQKVYDSIETRAERKKREEKIECLSIKP